MAQCLSAPQFNSWNPPKKCWQAEATLRRPHCSLAAGAANIAILWPWVYLAEYDWNRHRGDCTQGDLSPFESGGSHDLLKRVWKLKRQVWLHSGSESGKAMFMGGGVRDLWRFGFLALQVEFIGGPWDADIQQRSASAWLYRYLGSNPFRAGATQYSPKGLIKANPQPSEFPLRTL